MIEEVADVDDEGRSPPRVRFLLANSLLLRLCIILVLVASQIEQMQTLPLARMHALLLTSISDGTDGAIEHDTPTPCSLSDTTAIEFSSAIVLVRKVYVTIVMMMLEAGNAITPMCQMSNRNRKFSTSSSRLELKKKNLKKL
jgi:hypothetical protein